VLYGTVPELVATARRQRAFGIFYTGGVGAGALAPVLYGLASDLADVSTMMALVAAIVLQPHMTVVLLPALALYAVPSLPPEVRRWPFSRNVVWVLPIVFALYVCASALWAKDARQALAAGALFALLLLSMRIVFLAIMSAESRAIERLGRVYVAAVATGAVLLAVTIFFDGVLHKALTAISPIFAPSDRDFVRLDGNSLQFVGLPYFNRNVALLNLLLWPALLLLWRRVVDLRSAAPPVLLFGVVAVTPADVERDLDMPAVLLATAVMHVGRLERHLRNDGHAVVGFHALHQPMLVAQRRESLVRKGVVRALGLLQAQDVGFSQPQIAFDVVDPETDGIDVPGGDGEAHRRHYIGTISVWETSSNVSALV